MRPRLAIIPVLVPIVIGLIGCLRPSSSVETRTAEPTRVREFRDPAGRFEAILPDGWTRISASQGLVSFMIGTGRSPGRRDRVIAFDIWVLDRGSGLIRGANIEEISSNYIKGLNAVTFPGFVEKVSDEMGVFAGVEARDAVYRRSKHTFLPGESLREWWLERDIIGEKGELIYVLSYHVPEEHYYTFLPSVEEFLKSFEFLDS